MIKEEKLMAMKIYANYDSSGTSYAEKVREKQAAERAEQAKEAERAAEAKHTGQRSGLQDEYISSEKSGKKPSGLYRVGRDENGSRKIFYDDPKVSRNGQGEPEELCAGNTDKVDQEIKRLKEKRQELQQQIQAASGEKTPSGHSGSPGSAPAKAGAPDDRKENKIRELEKKLAQVEQELSRKDNDTYRRQHTDFSRGTGAK